MRAAEKGIWRTKRDFKRDLLASYKASKLQRLNSTRSVGAALILRQMKAHKVRLPRKVAGALSVLDDLILDAILWHHSLVAVLLDRPKPLSSLERAMMVLTMKIVQDAVAARNLIRSGFDLQAKNILRSIEEHANTALYLCARPEISTEFVNTDDDGNANRFWWKHIRSAREVVDSALQSRIKLESGLKELSEFKEAERKILSEAHHPSYAASIVFAVPYASASMYMFGVPSEYSYRTGKLLFYILAELAVAIGILNKEMREITWSKRRDFLHRSLRSGRKHLGAMALHLVRNWDAPIFELSKEMEALIATMNKN